MFPETMSELLITGGAGFIGSHTCLVLLEAGHKLVVLDNYSNSSRNALKRVAELSGPITEDQLLVLEGDICDARALDRAFGLSGKNIEAVVHFAGLKAVAESVQSPMSYWNVNLGGSLSLVEAMRRNGCRTIIFSSSATLYGYPEKVPISEGARVQPINPYGNTKAAVEQLLVDLAASEPGWRIACLRYFNPVGAHSSGLIGEDPNGHPNNLFPFVSQVAIGRRQELNVFGGDWPTPDGTCIRDYIHVMDLAEGHRLALEALKREGPQVLTLNLGTGRGYSVFEVIKAFEEVSGSKVPYKVMPRRFGDAACTVADPSLATLRLGWKSKRGLIEMCRDGWSWQKSNPKGY